MRVKVYQYFCFDNYVIIVIYFFNKLFIFDAEFTKKIGKNLEKIKIIMAFAKCE
jgi:hypothetical protein